MYPSTIDYWTTARNNDIRVRRTSEEHIRVEVTTPRGNVYACSFADDDYESRNVTKSRDKIEADWRSQRRSFRAFDQTTGSYTGQVLREVT